jgi:hypothetical protein
VFHALFVARAAKLRQIYSARAANRVYDYKENKVKLICHIDARHAVVAQTGYHEVVYQRDKTHDEKLQHHRQRD